MNELDILYSPSYWSKRLSSPDTVVENHLKFIEQESIKVTHNIQGEFNVPYGDTPRQKFDIIGTDLKDDAPIFIFLHGGYWQTCEITRSSYHFIAANLHQNGIKSIFIGYDLCPDVTLPQIVLQVEQSTRKVLEYASKKNSKGVYFMGHSAGAHLVASLFTNFIETLPEQKRSIVKGVILTSGVFDLSVLQKTVINEPLKLDEKVALEMSPLKQRVCAVGATKFCVIVGQNESPEFIKQSEEYSGMLKRAGFEVEFSIISGVDHFDIIEKLAEKEFEVLRRIVELIKGE